MTCTTPEARNRYTAHHHQRETSALGSARQNRYTNPLHTASAERSHYFASTALARGIPITDVSQWLGHRSIEVTYRIYRHLMPSAWDRARTALDQAYLEAMAAGPA